jgi:hypothetical protein
MRIGERQTSQAALLFIIEVEELQRRQRIREPE